MGQRTLYSKKWEMKRNGLAEVEKEAFVKTNPSISIHKSLKAQEGLFAILRKKSKVGVVIRKLVEHCGFSFFAQ